MVTYVAYYFAFDVEASVRDVGKVKGKEGVVVLREGSESLASNKRYRIIFQHPQSGLRACDFRLPSTWWVGPVGEDYK